MRKTIVALFAAALFAPSAASAQLYFGGHGGLNLVADTEATDVSGGGNHADITFQPGETYGAVVGGRIPVGARNAIDLEAEITLRDNEIDSYTDWWTGIDIPVSGDVSSTAYMVNLWFNFGRDRRWTPYVGGGLGLVDVETSGVVIGGTAFADDEDSVFAAQLGAGVAFAITPKLDLTLDYRVLATEAVRFQALQLDADYVSYSFRAGIKFRL